MGLTSSAWNSLPCCYWVPWWELAIWGGRYSRKLRVDMTGIPMGHALILAGILFALGLAGLLMRRNLIFILMSIEIMLNGTGVAFVAAGSRWGQPDGQIMFLFILAMAAAEVSVGLALVLRLYHLHHNLDADAANEMRG